MAGHARDYAAVRAGRAALQVLQLPRRVPARRTLPVQAFCVETPSSLRTITEGAAESLGLYDTSKVKPTASLATEEARARVMGPLGGGVRV
eukprot:7051938-Prymnesium_polylepis.1